MKKQLRMFFLKGKYLSNFSKDDVKRINIFLNKRKLKSLDGFSPEEVFIRILGKKFLITYLTKTIKELSRKQK